LTAPPETISPLLNFAQHWSSNFGEFSPPFRFLSVSYCGPWKWRDSLCPPSGWIHLLFSGDT
jgi:hypothetical protein